MTRLMSASTICSGRLMRRCSSWFVNSARRCSLSAGQLEAVRLLLQAGASTDVAVEGSPPLHAAVVVAAQPGRAGFAAAAVQLLLQAGADATQR